ncbi:F-box/LRR-repeat protein 2-like [Periplaneta americana]|uniref:F-box/LRR-repeat protein 2-like n=1 Tax=Periplaneta americana TaxID=6978 RepID=UPI0037E7FAAA
MVDVSINDLVVQLVDYKISKWKMDGDDDESSQPNSVNNEGPPIRKLFVGNLSDRTTYCDLRRLFRRYGKVVDAHVSRDRITQAKKRFGFVTFKYPEDASSVLKLKQGELRLHLRTLHVAPADSWHQPVELPDGTVLWKSNEGKRRRHNSDSEQTTSEDDQLIGAVGGSEPSCEASHVGNKLETGEKETEIDEPECKIHILNDDCLMHIFSFLSKRERIRIERVCKRWQMVCLDMWVCQKHLDFTSLFPASSNMYLDMPILTMFLKRCGRNLHSLDLSHKPHELSPGVLRIVATFCKNLRCLNLAGLPVAGVGLKLLSNVSAELRVLNLDGCSGALDKDLQILFQNSRNLESVTLSHNNSLTGKCLNGLSHAPLKELVLDECNNLRSRSLVNGLHVLKSLRSLSLNSCINLTSSDVAGIIGALPNLQSLSMTQYFPLFSNTALKPLDQLHDLISLNLQLNPAVNDQLMGTITRSCHSIEELNITGCSINSFEPTNLTDAGLKCLAELPNLVDLSMSYLANVSDEALKAIACKGKLRKLVCRGCPTFTDVGCISVVTSCSELELFDFSGCDQVTNATVEAALESVKLRTNNVKLTLVVGATSVCESATLEENSLLEVDSSDLCVAHLRPDFVDDIYFPSSENEEDYDYYMDDMCEWEWECHSVFFGDDLEFCDDFYDDADCYEFMFNDW